ncbi:hypothetical protein CHU_2054 [Sporocytophaga myxococcoides]|uniref:Uncharacterized protein n=1 Tax=Sporocytophaga myxococcoides TaxID=153721 RepID=A0A098LEB9_9BACT|nr:hypothetical protein [Sporocytophaga myxococcoides]GAL84759.1 hypothetical protein CHU_2054 [Sporocytophaga myxococcoides]
MNIGEETLELIDRYLSDTLTKSEKESFNLRLAQDAEFKTLVENQKLANDLILGDRLYSLKSMMDEDFLSGRVNSNQNSLSKGKLLLFGGFALIVSAFVLYMALGYKAVKQYKVVVDSDKIVSNQNSDVQLAGTIPNEVTISTKNKKVEGNSNKLRGIAKLSESEHSEAPADVDALLNSDNEPAIIVKDDQDKTELLPLEVEIRCAVKTIQAKVKSEPACVDKKDGRLIVGKISNLLTPLSYGISSKAADTLWQSSNIFSNLPSGNYAVSVKDANGCLMHVKDLVEIGLKECRKAQQTYSFNPGYGETINMKVEGEGGVTIWNRAGIVVFSANVFSGQEFTWDGHTSSGGISAPGVYIYSLEYQNGNTVRGEILIY